MFVVKYVILQTITSLHNGHKMENKPSFDALDLVNHNKMMIIWDTGPRCNFDCTYCTDYMHDNHSPHPSLEELLKTADFVNKYYERYKRFHGPGWDKASISFTGGEPTVNPNFWKFVDYMYNNYDENFKLGLTTNGTWHPKHHDKVIKYFKGVTVSYHTEGAQLLKDRCKENLLLLKDDANWITVNVMMHTDNWDECVELIDDFLIPNKINYTPRVIGDSGDYEKGTDWFKDTGGKMRRITHFYEPWKLDWLREHWAKQNQEAKERAVAREKAKVKSTDFKDLSNEDDRTFTDEDKIKALIKNRLATKKETVTDEQQGNVKAESARKLGRMCCGGRTLCTKDRNTNKWDNIKFANSTEFKGWKCMVNWFFLHIEQGRDTVLHHQTCQARFDGTTGPIGKLSESDKILEELDARMAGGKMPVITCPNNLCGCGMCVPKAETPALMQPLWDKYTENLVGEM